jgi:hypothetical protein
MKGERTTPTTTTRMKTSSRRTVVIVVALLAATIVTVGGIAIPIVKPAYAQLDISREQVVGEIPDSDDIKEKAREIISQSVPRLPEQATALFGPRSPPALADYTQ